ncbi:MAG TPA: hypothetical protein VK177_16590 [Flavobacteriales bacterium]|nr:hypothetical protein [Flavobacteriales bacterium]
MKTIKKLLFVSVAFTFLLQSCSTGHMFSKKRYGHLNWIDHDTKVETVGSDKQNGATITHKQVEKTVPVNELKQSEGPVAPVNAEQISQDVPVTNEAVEETPAASTHKTQHNHKRKPLFEEGQQSHFKNPVKTVHEKIKKKFVKSVKNTKSGSTGELVGLALLIVLILVIFLLLDEVLGGLLTWLLGLFILVLIILLLLRYLGAI